VDKKIIKKSKKVSKEEKKTFILDTNILLSDPECLKSFQNNDIVLPLIVVEELDRFKDKQDDVGKYAREISRQLIDLVRENKDLVKTGISLGKFKGTLKILNQKDLESTVKISIPELDYTKGDNKIIQFCLEYKQKFYKEKVILVTRDLLLRIKAISLGVECEDYKKLSKEISRSLNLPASESEFYSGVKTFEITKEEMDKFYLDKSKMILTEEEEKGLYINQFIVFESKETSAKIAGRYIAPGKPLKHVPFDANIWNIKSKNIEQAFLMDLLMDDKINLITVNSRSGAGKTLLSLACALELTLTKRSFKKILITRNIQPLGKDLGALPGPQPLDAKILTPTGWTTMGQLKIGDSVISRDGKPTKVIGVFPKGEKEVYKITTTEGQVTECCEDHLWETKTFEEIKRGKKGKVRSTKELKENLLKEVKGHSVPNFYIPRNEQIQYNLTANVKIPGYTMGVLIGDGSVANTGSFASIDNEIIERVRTELKTLGCNANFVGDINYNIVDEFKISNKKADFVEILNESTNEKNQFLSVGQASKILNIKKSTLQTRCKNNLQIDEKTYKFIKNENLYSNKIKNILNHYKLLGRYSYNKFIPKEYLYNSSIETRIALLQGLMDTDGTIKQNGEASFSTVSEQLKNDFIELVYGLGGKAVAYKRKPKMSSYKDQLIKGNFHCYDIRINLPNEINPFFLKRKANRRKVSYMHHIGIKSIEKIGFKKVQCIRVENEEHLYITNDFIVTHNTAEEKMAPWIAPFKDNLEFLLNEDVNEAVAKGASKGKKGENLKHSFMMQDLFDRGIIQVEATTFIRGRSIPNCIFIVDECQNLTMHEMKTILTRVGEGTKIILLGDPNQIDNTYLNKFNNGLVVAIEKLKGNDIVGHMTLTKGERSKLATLASDLL